MNKQQTFDCKFKIKRIHEENGVGVVEGFAATFGNTDRVNDIIVEGAFTDSIEEIRARKGHIPMLFQHDFRKVIGKFRASEMRLTPEGLFVKGEINLKTDLGKNVHELLKAEDISDFSIGFITKESHLDEDKGLNFLEKIDLKEISIVTFPANEMAVVTAVKTVVPFQDLPILRDSDGDPDTRRQWDSNKAVANIRRLTGSEDEPSSTYRNAFLWFDGENADNFGAYKLPIADAIDGEMVAIPRGVFAAAGALLGARGGVDIPDNQRPAVQRNIERYYDKMDLESPFSKGLGPNELSRMSPKMIKTYLRDNGFSVAGAEYLSDMANKGIKSLRDSGSKKPSDSDNGSLKGLLDDLKQTIGA